MSEVIDFNSKRIDKNKKKSEKNTQASDVNAKFFDESINPAFVYDTINDPEIRLAFVQMLLALRQISTDGCFDIAINADHITFDSRNSVSTSEMFDDRYQTNINLMKQAYLLIADDSSDKLIPQELIADALESILDSLIMHSKITADGEIFE